MLQLLLLAPGEGGCFFFPYLCRKEMIINNLPGCVAAGLCRGKCIFLWHLELQGGFNLGVAGRLQLLSSLGRSWRSRDAGGSLRQVPGATLPHFLAQRPSPSIVIPKANRAVRAEQTAARAAAGGRLHRVCAAESAQPAWPRAQPAQPSPSGCRRGPWGHPPGCLGEPQGHGAAPWVGVSSQGGGHRFIYGITESCGLEGT